MRLGRKLATGVAEEPERIQPENRAAEDGVPDTQAVEKAVISAVREHRGAPAGRVAAG